MGYPDHDQAMSVVESARRLCKAKMRDPSASPDDIHDLEAVPFGIDIGVFDAGRRDNSITARSASKRPVLLYPPVLSFMDGHTKLLHER